MSHDQIVMTVYGITYLFTIIALVISGILIKIQDIKLDLLDDLILFLIICGIIPFVNVLISFIVLMCNIIDYLDNKKMKKAAIIKKEYINYKKEYDDLKEILIAQNIVTSEQLEDLIDSIKVTKKLISF